MPTKIWVLDHNYSLWGRAIDELSDPAAYEYIDGIAWHGYVGEPSAMSRVHDAFPQKSAYWTEGGPDIAAPDYQTDYAKWAGTFNDIVNNWARSITSWNLALDEKGRPNIGPFSCGGLITIDNGTHKVTRSGQYWAFAHYSKHVRRGAKCLPRMASVIWARAVRYRTRGSAILTAALWLWWQIAARNGACNWCLDRRRLTLRLPADSVHTLQWA